MVRVPYDLAAAEKANPRPKDMGEDEHYNPWSPRPEVLRAYKDANSKYEKDVHDRAGDEFYELVNPQADSMTQELTQVYRIRIANEGEFMYYDLLLRGNDWKGNEHDFAHREGIFKMPLFRFERDPSTKKVTNSQINDHKRTYNIPWSPKQFDELMESAVENISLVIHDAGHRIGIRDIHAFRDGNYEDVVQSGIKGKSLEAVIAERNQFTYEKRETKQAGDEAPEGKR
jgi:hypothetical protein